jgi:eukaryotic-like serine/threonine-protein kinase
MPTDRHANFDWRVGTPVPIGIYPADVHKYGVRDLAGNVWEWCFDHYAPYTASHTIRPSEAAKSARVYRGGSFTRSAGSLRGAYRFYNLAHNDARGVGFRVAWSVAGGQT